MKKYISIAIAAVVLVGAYFISNAFINSKENQPKRGTTKKEKEATTVIVKEVANATIPISVKSSGSLMAKERIQIFSEVQGVFNKTSKEFKPGVRYSKGEVLLKMNAEEQYANLQAQKSTLYNQITLMLPDLKIDYADAYPNWQNYVDKFDVEKPVAELPKPLSTKEKIFVSSKNVYTTFYNIKSLEIRQSKYTIVAPFTGVLTEALVTPGTLVRPSQQLGEFISTNVFEMEVAVSVSLMDFMKIGEKVEVRSMASRGKTWEGKVVRVNGKVDRASQTITVFLEVRANDLEEGMYLEAVITAREEENAYTIDRKQLQDGNKVFVVRDSLLKLIEVNPVYFDTNGVVVKGLEDGEMLLAKSVPGAYEGMKVFPITE